MKSLTAAYGEASNLPRTVRRSPRNPPQMLVFATFCGPPPRW
ncbi:hypothetical protein PLANPX_0896 [Lacipirellula parvula]|uniref:Uncharacterized protein n=1 Tax=Lacipirellula parvula TaxID=2650471 RepID=A0A5K7X3P7_9BACT|nr:hypothetical protein PLANPX_0896 [Lacipirellula parvula]